MHERYFAVTTPGLSATRWLSHVLASHPDVYVAHGKFALDSVMAADLHQEKETANLESLTRGNQTRDFYESRPLEEVLALYRGLRPGASAYGCVHSYTMHTLAQAAQSPATLNSISILNVVRHPVDFIASHDALVRAAEKHPRLYHYYLHQVFPQVLSQFPELYLMKCPDFRAFFAFAISCHAVNNLLFDMCYPGIRHVKMETLTTQADTLGTFCRDLTGLAYSSTALEEFIRLGAINQHRPGQARRHPHATYMAWEPWQRDMAHVVIPGLVLDWLEGMGYDLAMFRAAAAPSPAAAAQVPCLADCLRSLDERHPLLAYMTSTGAAGTQKIAADYQGFTMTRQGDCLYAVARSLPMPDLARVDEGTLRELHEDGLCLRGASMGEIWRAIAHVLAGTPKLIQEYRGYNLITFREVCYAAPMGVTIHFERLKFRERQQLMLDRKLVAGATLANVKRQIDNTLARTHAGARDGSLTARAHEEMGAEIG